MKLSTFIAASSASLALAVPAAPLEKRADFCDQWGSQVNGPYTTYNNLWGKGSATSGSQCTGVDSYSGTPHGRGLAGTHGQVKSYANVVTNVAKKQLSSINSLPSVWKWSYTGSNIIADVAYDLFTSSSPSGKEENEIMIWLAALGGAGPISSTGSPIATVTLAGNSWKLYKGPNGQMTVYSFVAQNQVQNFNGDLMEFVRYLTSKQGLASSQYLISAGAGTEPFSGSNAKLTVSEYSLSEK
ncbi:glycoside hydrolase family 12 protein [Exserohilum turcica Et28A]|uniref:Glycoside hydrolase family 12 protein n=1 Tax=Exserohilum turcicum (strain 28A) TaxID=671987 RepID=R0K6R4_EXST2|nr:glycoside hydrolase family 12 protein [Exserohilum turcica Et28A]EOA85229.1 glycoside hydrolase family 12 protein [Exserohilum turcica Et28A]